MSLPIEELAEDLRKALAAHPSVVLEAPPGAGKTTRVPLILSDAPWLSGQKIIMLEPRRLAARAAARQLARQRHEPVGASVGYRVRLDTRVGPRTQIEVVTEGILTRMLQTDPALEGVGLLIFDEFHERSLQADLGLALARQAQQLLRPELRLLVMSATLDAAPVAQLLAGADGQPAPRLVSAGRAYPVATHYRPPDPAEPLEVAVGRVVREALAHQPGDVLVFLPGQAEIRRTATRLREALPTDCRVYELYGDLSAAEQDQAIAPAPPGQRKVVLATNIAETSLTIEGVRTVVDSGWTRVARYQPHTELTRLDTVRVARAAADQRRGRAGRTAPGVAYRLWSASTEASLAPFAEPEIRQADLAPLALELALWGVRDADELAWLDPPPAPALARARELLRNLGALDGNDQPTAHGRAMSALGAHPRLAHLLLRGRDQPTPPLACAVAALLQERDPLRASAPELADPDLELRVLALRAVADNRRPPLPAHLAADVSSLRRVHAQYLQWLGALRLGDVWPDTAALAELGVLVALAYPDRIAQRTGPHTWRLRSGLTVRVPEASGLAQAQWLAVAHLDSRQGTGRVLLAATLHEADVRQLFGEQLTVQEEVGWVKGEGIRARRTEKLGALTLREQPWPTPDPAAVQQAWREGLALEGLSLLPWTPDTEQLRDRLAFLHRAAQTGTLPTGFDWPAVDDGSLLAEPDRWLLPHLAGLRRRDDLRRLDLAEALLTGLDYAQRQALDRWAPTHLAVPSGSRRPLDYRDPERPILAVRLQEMFGLLDTPRIAEGRVPLLVHLLSPAGRPVQVTRDLASFWRTTYFEVRKDLRGRYPKHHWPDDPLSAVPTARAKPRK